MLMDAETLEHYAVLGLRPGTSLSDLSSAEAKILQAGESEGSERMWLASGAIICRSLEEYMGEPSYALKEACEQIGTTEAIMRGRDPEMPPVSTFRDIIPVKAIRSAYERRLGSRQASEIEDQAFYLLMRAEKTQRRLSILAMLSMSREEMPRAILDQTLARIDTLVADGLDWGAIYLKMTDQVHQELGMLDVRDLVDHPYLAAKAVDILSAREALRALMELVNGQSQITDRTTKTIRGNQLFIVGDEGFTVTSYTNGPSGGTGNKRRELKTKVFAQNVEDVAVVRYKLGFKFRNNVYLSGFTDYPLGNPQKVNTPIFEYWIEFPTPCEAHAAYNLFMRWFDEKRAQQAARDWKPEDNDNQGLGIDWFEQTE